MKTISAALDGHLNLEVTTLCTCWRIERTDGVVLGFTTLDQDIFYNGVNYESQFGYSRTALSGGSDFSVDNMDVNGVLDSDTITNEDLRNGAYNFARVFVFLLNYEDVSQGELPLRTGWFGEVSTTQRGEFTAELRGLNQALSHNTIEVFTPECRADFCDKRCKLKRSDFMRRASIQALSGNSRTTFRATNLPSVPGVTSVGAHRVWGIRILHTGTGVAHGGIAEVKFYDQSLDEIEGGEANATSSDVGHRPSAARDGKTTTWWRTADLNSSTPAEEQIEGQIWYTKWSSPVDVKEIMLTACPDIGDNPIRFELIYGTVQFEDDDIAHDEITWSDVQPFAMTWTTAGQNAIWGVSQTGEDPLSLPQSLSSIPPPFTGASTYIGGTVTFRTGHNHGKTMEISGLDNNNFITLFEGMPFEFQVGDVFDIVQGCNKDPETCKLYNNIINFRGEPDVPGQDEYLKYPDAPTG
jgi:hypothetical protein